MNPIVETSGLCKRYNESVSALSNVDVCIEKGEFAAIVGRSGSGKSTLMNIIGCLDSPTSGTVRINSCDIDYKDPASLVKIRRTVIGFVFQQFNLIPNLTARENIEYPLLFNYHPPAERLERVDYLLAQVGLMNRGDHYPQELSGGEQQRIAIARALVNKPLLVLADEPTGNLDSGTGESILGLIKDLNRTQGTTFVIVTHDSDLASHADRTISISDGMVVG
ncbi:ABC transporter ATP-binding protein [Methanolacinia paynteri]|uniref:ABC transporter ATP-binding protein n=1 Tax=Methanolacinia paynteri TaxID=230356 RepID=UPI00064ECAD2|nr:ABC transporter ATP-binding protein [Methanolacinia paynteri]